MAALLLNYRDSFESESPSEEEDGKEIPPLKQPSHNTTTSRSASSTTSEHRDRRAPKDRSESHRNKGEVVREVEKKGQMSGSYGSGSESGGSNKSSGSTIRAGDKVVVYLPSGGKAKGTISAESSRDRYEVTLENGDVEKRVHSRNIALARRRRQQHRSRDDDRRKKSSSRSLQKKGSLRRRESRHEILDRQHAVHDALLSESGSQAPRDHHSGSPSSSSVEAHKDHTATGDGPASPISQGLSTATSAASGGGDPAQQLLEVESHSPDTAPTGQTLAPIEAPVSESEPDTSNGERESSSERGSSSPLSSKVRQAQGLLKTVRPTAIALNASCTLLLQHSTFIRDCLLSLSVW